MEEQGGSRRRISLNERVKFYLEGLEGLEGFGWIGLVLPADFVKTLKEVRIESAVDLLVTLVEVVEFRFGYFIG